MKRSVLSLCLVSCFLSQSQIKYEFDYALEYEYIDAKDSTNNHKITYYSSSKANNYMMSVRDLESNKLGVNMNDNKRFTLIIQVHEDEFNKAYVISNNCEGISKWDGKRYKKYTERYSFNSYQDTILNGKLLSHYKIEALPKSRGIKDKSAYNYFLVDESKTQYLPMFNPPLDYEMWLRDKPFLNGIIEEYGKYSKKHGFRKYKLVNVKKVKKVFQIPENCNQTN
ncbi:hypothetical protein [Winogradskyella sp. A2]|uniref:hypothetical protein n=1 Tax=Winogradskyella sp. A2 TaxID=3366944 RepID=UPI00398C7F50